MKQHEVSLLQGEQRFDTVPSGFSDSQTFQLVVKMIPELLVSFLLDLQMTVMRKLEENRMEKEDFKRSESKKQNT